MSHSQITTEEKIHCLETILKSKAFKSDSTYRKILCYYMENLQNNSDTYFSETSIALDALDKDLEFNPYYDSSVRVAMHRLRNLLVNYYAKNGKDDVIKIHIPIGDYNPFFYKETKKSDSADYCIKMIKAAIFQIEYTLTDHSVELYSYVIQTNTDCLKKNFRKYHSYSTVFGFLHYPLILNKRLPVEENNLDEIAYSIYRNNPDDVLALILKTYYCFYRRDYKEASILSQKAFTLAKDQRSQGSALVLHILSGFFNEPIVEVFYELQKSYTQHPPYWFLVNLVMSLKNNQISDAYEYVKRFNAIPSKLSQAVYLSVKRKVKKLSKPEMQYIEDNPSDFSKDYLSYFLSSVIDSIF
ncbi:hypothetical protein [Spirochaeta isovalerica]|uniref:Tetratricopeptide (TPR) repeat protein n=1 Tax=Spirochaeta isovalerica TaxID=150 RepID=A0A841RFX0_9SPIO|nr:hypothetical protein [Spirochaeta isovalerica]MBB6481679.1 tetratricopeptide (TPR) repeat protein [Spirochaeta isovalerica]